MVVRGNIEKDKILGRLIFGVLWVVLFLIPIIQGLVYDQDDMDFLWKRIIRFWMSLLPFLVAFLLHHKLLIPIYIKKERWFRYASLMLLLVSFFAVGQYFIHKNRAPFPDRQYAERDMVRQPRRGPSPVLIDSFLLTILLSFDMAMSLIMKYRKAEVERRQLESMHLQDELRYLKSQIDPHFFMNMLNNIHSMVEVNPELAQQMILDLSKLMRYVLYEGSNSYTTFENEVLFISKYVELMRQRYPSDKVVIALDVPDNPSASVMLPPLLFISFVENAFKHGVSYLHRSEIYVSLSEDSKKVCFKCTNTRIPSDSDDENEGGVGLVNVRRRLDLLYEDRYVLDIDETEERYSVNLIIPGL